MFGANAFGWAYFGDGYAGPTGPAPTNVKGYIATSDAPTMGATASDAAKGAAKASNA